MKARSELARSLGLFAAPLFTLLLFLFTSKAPLHVLEFPDPDFGYLFSSLTITLGGSPWHVDHPGTPLQLLGALVMWVRYLFLGKEGTLLADFFRFPVAYHQAVMNTSVAFFLAAQLFCGRSLRRLGIPLTLCIFSQLCPLLIWDGLVYLDHVSPETLLSAAGLCLIPLLAESSMRDESQGAARRAIAVGICLALMASLKANSFPLVACIFLLRKKEDRLLAFGSMAGFYLCVTVPIWEHFPRMFSWYLSLLSHRGLYGQGPADNSISAIAVQASDPDLLLRIAPLIVCAWVLFFARFLQKRDPSVQPRWPLILSGSVIFLLVMKHPGSRYFLPLCVVVALGAIQICRQGKRYRMGLAAAAVLAALYAFPNRFQSQLEIRSRAAKANEEMISLLEGKYRDCHLTVLDDLGIPPFTLFSGNLATEGERFGPELREAFPHVAFRQTNLPTFRFFGGSVSEAEWAEAIFASPCRIVAAKQKGSEENFREVFHAAPRLLEKVGPGNFLSIYGFEAATETRYRKVLADWEKEKGSVRDWTKP
jgi:hypothetical protein